MQAKRLRRLIAHAKKRNIGKLLMAEAIEKIKTYDGDPLVPRAEGALEFKERSKSGQLLFCKYINKREGSGCDSASHFDAHRSDHHDG